MWTEKEEAVNWVAQRGKCHTPLKVLFTHMKHDVDEMNKLLTAHRSRYSFRIYAPKNGKFKVTKILDQEDEVDQIAFHISGLNSIVVYASGARLFTVNYSWNEEEAICEFSIEDVPHELYKISQKALSDVFFTRCDLENIRC